jgi:molybdenum cofactor biosynthesis enzyme MoaA
MKIDFTHVAIEIIDGCNYSCSFCIRNAILAQYIQIVGLYNRLLKIII